MGGGCESKENLGSIFSYFYLTLIFFFKNNFLKINRKRKMHNFLEKEETGKNNCD